MARGWGKRRYQIFVTSVYDSSRSGSVKSKKFGSKTRPSLKQRAVWKGQGKVFKVVDMWGGWK